MDGRRRVPFILLGLLTVLAAAGLFFGLRWSPPGGNVIMQNATAATYGAPVGSTSFAFDLVSAVSANGTAGVISQVRQVKFNPPSSLVVQLTQPQVEPPKAAPVKTISSVISEYAEATLGSGHWVQHGSELTRTESLVTYTDRVTPGQTPLRGTVYESAIVRNGYLVYVGLRVVIPAQSVPSGQTVAGSVLRQAYLLLRIDGRPAPAANLP